jgi:hypothetical protein
MPQVRDLPRHDASHWQGLLDEARLVLEAGLANPLLSPDELGGIAQMRDLFMGILDRWPTMVELLERTPATLTHGDLAKHNIKMSLQDRSLCPMVFDWETAGYGSPMIDLVLVDLAAYHKAVVWAWSELDLVTLGRLRALGAVIWTAYVLLGERENLASPWPHRAAAKLPVYRRRIESYGATDLLGLEVAS